MTHTPRRTGEVLVPLAVTLRTLPCDRKPPRGGGEFDLADANARHAGYLVVFSQTFVEHREIGLRHIGDRQVRLDQFPQKRFGLHDHEQLQITVELGVEFFVGCREVHVPQVQP